MHYSSGNQDFQKDFVPVDPFNLMQARQPHFQNKKNKNNSKKAFITLNPILFLHIPLANPKPGADLFATSLIILHETIGTTQ